MGSVLIRVNSLGGYVSWNDAGDVTASNVSFSVGETVNPEKTDSE